jgi:hypothetical protein
MSTSPDLLPTALLSPSCVVLPATPWRNPKATIQYLLQDDDGSGNDARPTTVPPHDSNPQLSRQQPNMLHTNPDAYNEPGLAPQFPLGRWTCINVQTQSRLLPAAPVDNKPRLAPAPPLLEWNCINVQPRPPLFAERIAHKQDILRTWGSVDPRLCPFKITIEEMLAVRRADGVSKISLVG